MNIDHYHVSAVPLPLHSSITRAYPSTNLSDAYAIELPARATTNPALLAKFIFSQQSLWMKVLMTMRDALVAGFGLKTIKHLSSSDNGELSGRIGFFKVYSSSETEIVLGEDDKHLDFRLSVLCSGQPFPAKAHCLTISTVVHCHSRLGRLYIFLITPFHRAIVRSLLRRAARAGWPLAEAADH